MDKTRAGPRGFCWLTLLGIPGFLICGIAHVCMAGHMQHPPYSWLNFAIDGVWVVCFAAAAVLAFRSRLPRRLRVSGLLVVLIVSRLLLGSWGGELFLFELPAVIYLGVIAGRGLWRLRRAAAVTALPDSGAA
jgi:hypothetical protein